VSDLNTIDDETLASIREVCGTTRVDDDRSIGSTSHGEGRRHGIFGGQMISQALHAAHHTVPEGSVPESVHVNLLSGGYVGDDIEFVIERVRDGRNLQHRDVRGYQRGKPIVHASIVAAIPTEGLDWQRDSTPAIAEPDLSPKAPEPWGQMLGWGLFDVAHRQTDDVNPSSHPVWLRSPVEAPPGDPWLHAAVYAFWSDFGPNWSIQVSHREQSGNSDGISSVSATHSIWFHTWTPIDRWHLFDAQTHRIAHHQGMIHCSLHDQSGRLNATVMQGIYIRA
jgi:acyl-CoA thioesterase-2